MSQKIEQYKAYLQDLGNIGSRHETARGFYLSVLSALLTFLALAGKEGPLKEISRPLFVLVGFGGVAICCLWLIHTLVFNALYKAKFERLSEMEKQLPFQNFGPEYSALEKDWKYIPLTCVECGVAVVFILLFAIAMLLN